MLKDLFPLATVLAGDRDSHVSVLSGSGQHGLVSPRCPHVFGVQFVAALNATDDTPLPDESCVGVSGAKRFPAILTRQSTSLLNFRPTPLHSTEQ